MIVDVTVLMFYALIGTLFAWLALAKRTKNMTRRLEAKTIPDFFEKRFNSPRLKFVSAVVIFLFLIPYSASVYNGLSNLFEIVFDIPDRVVMLRLAGLTAVYLFFGGYFAAALSEFIQGIIMLIGVICMATFFVVTVLVSLCTEAPDKEVIERVFHKPIEGEILKKPLFIV